VNTGIETIYALAVSVNTREGVIIPIAADTNSKLCRGVLQNVPTADLIEAKLRFDQNREQAPCFDFYFVLDPIPPKILEAVSQLPLVFSLI
jgi:hypothetical protein